MKNISPGILVKPFLLLFIIAGILTFTFPRLTNAQTQNIQFEHLSSVNGLSQNSILCMSQDSKGFMWFGTYEGLNRYDGYEFKQYKSEIGNPYSLCNNTVQFIYEDHKGNLWIGTDDGLDKFDQEKDGFIHYRHDPNDSNSLSNNMVRWICEDTSGMFWIGTYGGGLNQFDMAKNRFIRYQNNPNDPKSLSHNFISNLYIDRSGNLWVGTDGGLNLFDRVRNQFIRYLHDPNNSRSLNQNSVYRIIEDRSGVLWIGFWGSGLDRFDRVKNQFIHYKNRPDDSYSLSGNVVRSIYEDRMGHLWIGTWGAGLDQYDRNKNRFIHYRANQNDPGSLSNNSVLSIYEDRSGILWVGNDFGGINKFDRGKIKFAHYKKELNNSNSLNNNIVYSIEETFEKGKHILWFGTDDGGLNKYDRDKNKFTYYKIDPNNSHSINDNNCRVITKGRSGILWIGTSQGLSQFDPTSGYFINYVPRINDSTSLSNNTVFSICEDKLGYIWVGTFGGGLNKFDSRKKKFTHYFADPKNPNSLSDNFIWSIVEDRTGVLWIGTGNGGLNQFDREKNRFIHYQVDPHNPNGLSGNKIICIYEDRSGMLWLGTTNGLNKFDKVNKRFFHYLVADGLPSNAIQSILEDEHGNLWLGTQKGLSKFDPRTNMFKNFKVSDGLQSNEFSVKACLRSQTGEMYFGGINGFNAFFPDSIKDNPYIPSVVVKDFQVFNKSVAVGKEVNGNVLLEKSIIETKEICLSYKESVFSFEFASLHLSSPEENKYAYMMEGFDKGWNYTDANRRFVTYTNLRGGEYVFRVKGSNSDGVWNETGTSIRVIITPPYWQTLWFRLILLVVFLGIIYWIYKRSMRARDIAAEKQIEEVIAKEHALLRALIDTVPDRIYAKDAEGRFIVCNTAVDRKFGVAKSEQIIGKTDFDFYPQELAARYHQDDQMIMELNQPLINHEESTVDFAGNRLWTLTTKIPMRDSQGQIVGLVGTSHDITERRRMEEALNTERNLLRTLIDNLPDAVFVKDLECRKIIANPVDVRAMGAQSEAEVIGKTDDLFFSAETAATSFAEDQSVLQTGIPILGREGSYFDKQGNKLYVLSFKMPLRDEHGTIVGIVGATHDITEQKRFQEALQRERTILRTLIDNIPDAIWVKDIQSRKVISNLADVRFMGFQSEAEVLGKDDFDLFPKELADGFYADDQSAIQTGKPIIDREEYLFDEQGNKRWLFTSKLPLRDENNQIIGLVGIGRDITEQKKARETLQQERNLLRILIDNLPDLIFFKDTQGRYILDNLPHLRSLGAENQEEIIGKTSYDFNPPELAKLYTEDEIKVVQSGKPMLDREEIAVHRDTGEKYWHLTSRVPLFDSQGKVTGIVGIARDITERKHAEEERERLIKELQEAAADIKILSGLVPICSSCKKIRDDKGYWTQLEGYIQAHSEAKFSHGVCPDCMKKLYPNFVPKKKE